MTNAKTEVKGDVKTFNAAVNERIQELANRVLEKKSVTRRKDLNEMVSLLTPKLRFFVWNFMASEADTDDVLYGTLEKICVSIDSYNPAFRFTTWAFNIAKNEALTWLNKRPKNVVDIDDYFYVLSNTLVDDSREILEKELACESVLADVYSEIQRVAIDGGNLMLMEADINQRRGKEIADMYDICENTVKTRIRAGRKRVRDSVMVMHPELKAKMVMFDL